jgi:hypothetical protein
MGKMVWCLRAQRPVGECADHENGRHRDWVSDLGPDDEPQHGGALVLVWAGDYRMQEVWVASGANIGNWYCLGNEFSRPTVWEPPKREFWDRSPEPPRPAGTIPQHPTWDDVLTRGPVSLLSHDNVTAYRAGWSNGRRRLSQEIESLAEDDSGADEVPGQ